MSGKHKAINCQPKAEQTILKPEMPDKELLDEALAKYKELYEYSTDILLKELERFNRADEKAAKYSTAFVFLLGVVSYFDKWIFEKLQWTDFPVRLPGDLPMFMAAIAGLLALILSIAGLFLTIHAIKLRPVKSRPLNEDILKFFEDNKRLDIYYGLARENSNALNEHRKETEKKQKTIVRAYFLMQLTLITLVGLFVMFCLYSWT